MVDPARRPLVAGNWKMNLNHLEAIALVQKLAFSLEDKDYDAVDVVVVPPFTDIRSVQTLIDGDNYRIRYGAQDLSPHPSGAYTGDISGPMLAKLGCSFAVIGHSERRQYHHETDEDVNAKIKAALAADMIPLLCVGEDLAVRQAAEHVPHCRRQVQAALAGIPADKVAEMVIAYEPIWAIGTGEVALPEHAQEVAAEIRRQVAELYDEGVAASTRVLYGGSVKASNAKELLGQADVDGALVGGASLDAEDFVGIIRFDR